MPRPIWIGDESEIITIATYTKWNTYIAAETFLMIVSDTVYDWNPKLHYSACCNNFMYPIIHRRWRLYLIRKFGTVKNLLPSEEKAYGLELLLCFTFDVTSNTCLYNCNLSLFWSLSLLEVKLIIGRARAKWLNCIRCSLWLVRALQLRGTRDNIFMLCQRSHVHSFARVVDQFEWYILYMWSWY